MDIATYKNDVWGREVLLGVSWDLLWLVCVIALVIVAAHAGKRKNKNLRIEILDAPGNSAQVQVVYGK